MQKSLQLSCLTFQMASSTSWLQLRIKANKITSGKRKVIEYIFFKVHFFFLMVFMWYTILFFHEIYFYTSIYYIVNILNINILTTSLPFSNHKYGLVPFKTLQRFDTIQKKKYFSI